VKRHGSDYALITNIAGRRLLSKRYGGNLEGPERGGGNGIHSDSTGGKGGERWGCLEPKIFLSSLDS